MACANHSTNTPGTAQEAWNEALAAFEAAKAKRDAIGAGDDDTSPAWEAACDEAWGLLETLLSTPAPDGPAMGEKARLVIEEAFMDWTGDRADNPQTIARLLAGTWAESALASLYIDGLRLSGSQSPIISVRPDTFDPEAWLAQIEAATGARLSKSDQWGNVAFISDRDGADLEEAARQLRTLYLDHASQVETIAAERDCSVNLAKPLEPLTPEQQAAGREALIDALASLSTGGPDHAAMREGIAEAPTPWGLRVEERGTGATV